MSVNVKKDVDMDGNSINNLLSINSIAFAHKKASGGSGTSADPWTGDAIQTAINSISTGTVYIQSGYYKPSSTITIDPTLNYEIEEGAVIDGNTIGAGTVLKIEGNGLTGTSTTLTGDTSVNDMSVNVNNETIVSQDDYVMLYDSSTVGDCQKGEIHKVESTSTGTISFHEGIFDTYTTTDTAKVELLDLAKRIKLENLKIKGGGDGVSQIGIYIHYTENTTLENITINECDQKAIFIGSAWRPLIKDLSLSRATEDGLGYGINLAFATMWPTIRDTEIKFCRHAIAQGGAPGTPGRVTETLIDNVITSQCTKHVIDSHIGVRHWTIKNSKISRGSDYEAIEVRGPEATIKDNIIRGGGDYAIYIHNDSNQDTKIEVKGNRIYSDAIWHIYIKEDGIYSHTPKVCKIADNLLEGTASGFTLKEANTPTDWEDVIVTGNRLEQGSSIVLVFFAKAMINNNSLRGGGGTGTGILLTTGDHAIVNDNIVQNYNIGINFNYNVSSSLATANHLSTCTTTVDDEATNTVNNNV